MLKSKTKNKKVSKNQLKSNFHTFDIRVYILLLTFIIFINFERRLCIFCIVILLDDTHLKSSNELTNQKQL